MKHIYRLIMLSVGLLLLSLPTISTTPLHAQLGHDPEAAREITAEINAWRLENGLWPLKTNPTLEQMAIDQATYLSRLDDIDDFHERPDGTSPTEDARRSPYRWPSFNRPDQISIGENAAVGSVATAMGYWQGSALHTRAALNEGYREIGVGAIPHRFGHLFITVFGARPNVLTTLYNPAAEVLYLTDERSTYAGSDTWIQNAVRIRMFDSEGRPLSEGWQPWEMTVDLPPDVGKRVFVLYSDGIIQTLSTVDLSTDVALLPETILEPEGQLVFAPTINPRPQVTKPPATEATNSIQTAPTVTETVSREATATATAQPAPDPDFAIIYDDATLTVVVVADATLDLTGVVLSGGETTLPLSRWAAVTDLDISALPSGHCVQAWSWLDAESHSAPSDCRIRRSVITISPDEFFWTRGDFQVLRNDQTLATCSADLGRCEVRLPERLQR